MRTQDCPPPETFDFSDEAAIYNMVQNGFGTSQQATTDDPFQPCFSKAGLAYGTAFLHHEEHEINVVPQSKEIPRQRSEEGNHGIDLNKTPKRKARRKKHRPKVIREDKPVRTPKPATPKPGTPRRARKTENTSQVKRKYVWKKKDSTSLEKFSNALGETVGLDGGSVRKSVRRCVNFDLDSQERERCLTSEMLFTPNAESQAAIFSFDTKLGVHSVLGRETGVLEKPLGEPLMFDKSSPKQSRSEDLPEPLERLKANFVSKINDLDKVSEPSIGEGGNLTEHTRKSNCLNVVGDLERSLEADEIQVASDKASDVLLKGTKRGHNLVYDAQVSTEINLMHAHSETDRASNNHDVSRTDHHFPQIHKKKRTNTRTSSGLKMARVAQTTVKLSNQSNMGHSQPSAHEKFTDNQDYICDGPQGRMGHAIESKELKSKTRGRRKKRQVHLLNPTCSNATQMVNKTPSCNVDSSNQHRSVNIIDDVILKLRYLNINGEYPNFTAVQQNALVLYAGRPGPVVTFEGSLSLIKKRRPRAKVDLDPESDRVWKLLMGKETGDGEPGVDNEKWWEEERRVFHGRVDSFISRMHIILGDRRFSQWKGSVLDSVIGVFLTQNVSDHLSSSAYMSLAAKFSVKSSGGSESQNAEKRYWQSRGIGNPSTKSFMELLMSESNEGPQEMNSLHKGSAPMENNGGIDQLTNSSIDQRPSFPDHFGYLDSRQCGISAEHLPTGRAAPAATFQQRGTVPTLQVETTQREVKAQPENCIDFNNQTNIFQKTPSGVPNTELKEKKVKDETKEKSTRHWDSLRKQAFCNGGKKERSSRTMDSMDYEALRNAHVNVISYTIRERGMNNLLAARMKGLLNRLVEDHGSTDMEWLRDVPPDQVKDYLLSIRGLGLKSTECVRLLTLHHLAFPVDTNVARIVVRLGWVPLQNLPDSIQLHLLEQYPMMEHIQKYLWPRLCKLDQETLYELHYQMITFGKVFCTKSKPNCNACPLKGECKHFASAFANSRLLTGPEDKSPAGSATPIALEGGHTPDFRTMPLLQIEESTQSHDQTAPRNCEPIIEEPASPEPEYEQTFESEIEDAFYNDPDEIPTINLNMEEFTHNLKSYIQENMDLQDGDISHALVAVTSQSANIPMPKLKNVSRLRTEHQVYEIPDSHPLLEGMDDREPDDPCPYLLALWATGETTHSAEPPKVSCDSQDTTKLCEDNTCFSCNTKREAQAKTVRGTLLIPCRTAMRGSFPLNGTYFQVNEVFADHYSSFHPINVPSNWIWNLPRRTVYFGTSVQTIFKGLTTKEIQHCFWRGFVCVRGFERASRLPKPLYARLHLSPSEANKEKTAAKAANGSNTQAATGKKS